MAAIGKKHKLYCDPSEVVAPIMDGLSLLYAKLNHTRRTFDEFVQNPINVSTSFQDEPAAPPPIDCPACTSLQKRRPPEIEELLFPEGAPPESTLSPPPSSQILNRDKSHLTCTFCGRLTFPRMISLSREKICSQEDDKTTRADAVYDVARSDRFDQEAKSCRELRRARECSIESSRISKRAREKHQLGFLNESITREAAREQVLRASSDGRDSARHVHLMLALDALLTDLEPIGAALKRLIRISVDYIWQESVRHSQICGNSFCTLMIKDRAPTILADAFLHASLSLLLDKEKICTELRDESTASVKVVFERHLALSTARGLGSGIRSLRMAASQLLCNKSADPLPPCTPPSPSAKIRPRRARKREAENEEDEAGREELLRRVSAMGSSSSDAAEEASPIAQEAPKAAKAAKTAKTAKTAKAQKAPKAPKAQKAPKALPAAPPSFSSRSLSDSSLSSAATREGALLTVLAKRIAKRPALETRRAEASTLIRTPNLAELEENDEQVVDAVLDIMGVEGAVVDANLKQRVRHLTCLNGEDSLF